VHDESYNELVEENKRLQARNSELERLEKLATFIIETMGGNANLDEIQTEMEEKSIPLKSAEAVKRVVLENNNEHLKQPSERHRTCPLAPLPVEAAPGCCRREVLAVPGAADG
jgi:hypothetical protein